VSAQVAAQSEPVPVTEQDSPPPPEHAVQDSAPAALAVEEDAGVENATVVPPTEGAEDSASTAPPLAPAQAAPPAVAEDEGWGDEADATGFDVPAVAEEPSSPEAAPSALSMTVSLRSRIALWSERLHGIPLAQVRQSVDLGLRYKKLFSLAKTEGALRLVADAHAEYDFAYLRAPERFDEATLEAYQYQIIGRDTYASLSLGPVELRFGRQIVAWGQGEIVSPLDIVSPRDLREPMLAELDAIRMAVLASSARIFFGQHSFEALAVHESCFGLGPGPLSDFSPLRRVLEEDPRIAPVLPSKSLFFEDVPGRFTRGAGQFYGRWSYAGQGLDLALYAASTLEKQSVLRLPSGAELLPRDVSLYLWHPRYWMVGHAGAAPLGSFVLRWELGFDRQRPLVTRSGGPTFSGVDFVMRDRFNFLLAGTYTGFAKTRLSLEYAQSVVVDNPAREAGATLKLFWPIEQPVFAGRLMRTFLRERLTFNLVAMLIGVAPFIGFSGRAELSYELREALNLGIAYATYLPSSTEFGQFYGFTQNDRVYATLRWDFLLD